MRKANLKLVGIALLLMPLFTSCELIEGIFEAGMWTGIIVVVAILFLIGWLISKLFSSNKKNNMDR